MQALEALEPRDAAAHFIARRAEGLTTDEQRLLTEWLARDASHQRLFDSADRAWQTFANVDDDEILAAMRAHALAKRPRASSWWRPAAAAAVLLVAVSAALLYFRSSPLPVPAIQYASARGEVKEITLPDGSSMTLDAESTAVARFSADGRNVELQRGRAFFAVTPDHTRPFAVTAAGQRVVAVGTRFDVNLAADAMTVTLLEGKVTVGTATLDAGQQFVERLGKATIRTIGTASENTIAWRTGLVSFDDQPLGEAVAVMNRYSPDQIVIRDASVASIRLSGQFRAGESQRFADTLAEMHGLRPVRRGNEIELTR